jgi:hypothetical protein
MQEEKAVGIDSVLDHAKAGVIVAPERVLPVGLEEIGFPDIRADPWQEFCGSRTSPRRPPRRHASIEGRPLGAADCPSKAGVCCASWTSASAHNVDDAFRLAAALASRHPPIQFLDMPSQSQLKEFGA